MSAVSADPGASTAPAGSPAKASKHDAPAAETASSTGTDLAFLDLRGPHEPLSGERAKSVVAESIEPRRKAGTINNVKRVALSGWGFGAEAAEVIAKELQTIESLEHVEFSDVGSGRTDAENIAVFTILADALGPAARAEALGVDASDERAQLVNVDISDNAVGIGAIERFRSLLSGNRRVQRLSLNNCGLSGVAMEVLNRILLRPVGETEAEVAAGTDGDGGEFAKAADPAGAAGGGGGEGGAESVPRTVSDLGGIGVPTQLRGVQLHNNMGGNDGSAAAAALVRASPDLRLFRFASTRGQSEGGEVLLEAIAGLRHLEHLDVSDNMFKSEACRASLVSIVKGPSAPTLRVLKISDLQLGDAAARDVLEAILHGSPDGGVACPRLEALFLGGNDITEGGGASKLLVQAARELPALRLLSVPNNELGWVIGGPLAEALRSRSPETAVRVLDISGNALGSAAIEGAACALASGLVGEEAVAAARKETEAKSASGEAGEVDLEAPGVSGGPAGGKSARAMTTREKDEAELDTTVPRLLLDDNTCREGTFSLVRQVVVEVAGGRLGKLEMLELFDDSEENEEEKAKIDDRAQWEALMVEDV